MKTSIDIDGERLDRLMKLTNLKTRKATIDYALREAERIARINRLIREALPGEAFADAIDPAYDLMALRARDKVSQK